MSSSTPIRGPKQACLKRQESAEKAQMTMATTVQALDPLSYGLCPTFDNQGSSSWAFRKLSPKAVRPSSPPQGPLTHEERLLALRKITSSGSSVVTEKTFEKAASSASRHTFAEKARIAMANLRGKSSGHK